MGVYRLLDGGSDRRRLNWTSISILSARVPARRVTGIRDVSLASITDARSFSSFFFFLFFSFTRHRQRAVGNWLCHRQYRFVVVSFVGGDGGLSVDIVSNWEGWNKVPRNTVVRNFVDCKTEGGLTFLFLRAKLLRNDGPRPLPGKCCAFV